MRAMSIKFTLKWGVMRPWLEEDKMHHHTDIVQMPKVEIQTKLLRER